jgi:hypothetical protein
MAGVVKSAENFLFEGGQSPKTIQDASTQLPAVPDPSTDPATQARLDDEQKAERKTRGRAATLLTGGAGVLSTASVARRTLLGS